MASREKLIVGAIVKQALADLTPEEIAWLQAWQRQNEGWKPKVRRAIQSVGNMGEKVQKGLGMTGAVLTAQPHKLPGMAGALMAPGKMTRAGGRQAAIPFSQDKISPVGAPDTSMKGAVQSTVMNAFLSPLKK